MKYVLREQRYRELSKYYSRVRYLGMGVTGDTTDRATYFGAYCRPTRNTLPNRYLGLYSSES